MIASIQGKILRKAVHSVIIEASGVGYELHVSLKTHSQLPNEGEIVQLWAYTHLRENLIELYGFFDLKEKEVFERLIQVSGVGPRLARNILSGIEAEELVGAIVHREKGRLQSIPGIGAKIAERLIIELKEKFENEWATASKTGSGGRIQEDALSALLNLGYKRRDVEKIVQEACEKESQDVQKVVKESLRQLAR
ncbi:MAG: Holliday junction branch migration protein RuvA [Deltaproteobacteria bacterium]|nr:Holliday junction branch migration protein RuvA [Deltaproteobacteria bacterium]